MSSREPPTEDLGLERSRFNGMFLDGISYGIFFVLTVQCLHTLVKSDLRLNGIASRPILLAYVLVTFTLATLGVAANAKYSQMIWIDMRNSPGGPARLILDELDFWMNRMALSCYFCMSLLMDLLLLFRCFVIWDWHILVIILMSLMLVGTLVSAIIVQIGSSKGAVFTHLNPQVAYLVISVSTNIVYTFLVTCRLIWMRRHVRITLGEEYSKVYSSILSMIIESSALFSVAGTLYVILFALHTDAVNLLYLWIPHVQGIAQLLVILRVAQGRAFTKDVTASLPLTHKPESHSSHSLSDSSRFPHINLKSSDSSDSSGLAPTLPNGKDSDKIGASLSSQGG